MSVFQRVRMPSLDGATGWVKSDPLGPAELRGHVVLVNFWTLTCINWLRHEPYAPVVAGLPRRRTVRERTLEITFLEPGAETYSFTFG
jgi:hypothetical protein